jgi:inhibitor of KinA
MQAEPLGDQAVMTRWDTEAQAFLFASAVRGAGASWVLDVVPAYRAVAVFYDAERRDYTQALVELQALTVGAAGRQPEGRRHVIPCCYDFGLDLQRVAEHTGLGMDAVIALHTDAVYTVYAIGFCPGFPYLGYLPEALAGVPRLESPRRRVEAGSVGLTGRQTGIYTEVRPGGWNIVGRTPCCLVDVADGYFPLRAGDTVEFTRIEGAEFQRRLGERLV